RELVDEISKTNIEILTIQEIRWSGEGTISKDKYTLFYSGNKDKAGQAGTGFLVNKKLKDHISGFIPINERLCKLRYRGKYNNVTLINSYAPTEEKNDDDKEKFYDDLQKTIDEVPKNDFVIILGDVNAKIVTNRNGEYLCEFATANNLIIMSTQFQHKMIHKGTWTSPDQSTVNEIDHVLFSKMKKELIEDVRSLR
ncbi:Craniofacial development protein 2, partial [Blattella germanica]